MKYSDFLKIDYLLLLPAIILLILGIFFIYSSGVTHEGIQTSTEYLRQIIWASIGIVAAITLAMINYRRFYNISIFIYIACLAALLYTLIFGRIVSGSARWIGIGQIGGQVSEFAKLAAIILMARYLADTDRSRESFARFIICCAIAIIPMGIVLLQPDLGTSLVFIAILLSMLFISGVSMKYIVFIVSCIGITGVLVVLPYWQTYIYRESIPLMAILTSSRITLITSSFLFAIACISFFGYRKFKKKYFYWIVYTALIIIFSLVASYAGRMVLRNYQIMRLIVFIDPNIDPRGAGWNIIQSVTAIGAGGLSGRGFLQGTQSHYQFLPEQSTDFIFSIFSEETGFLGGIAVFALYLLICIRLALIIKTTQDPFAKYICAGLAGMFSFHFIINVGMTMGIMPITGIPLLFMSYGGSAALTAMIGIGLALSVHLRRYNR